MTDYNINAVARRAVFSGSAGVGPYAFTFEVLANTDIAVYKNAVLQTLSSDYTVTINANGTGSVTLTTAATSSDTVTLIGARDIERTTDFTSGGEFRATAINDQLDSLTIFDQQLAEENKRALMAPPYDPAHVDQSGTLDMTLPAKSSRAGKTLAFNATTGNPEAGPDISSVQSVADASADIDTVAGIAANVTTVAGISSDVTSVANNSANVTTVASNASNITTVAGSVSNVNTVAGSIANVNTVASDMSDVTTVAGLETELELIQTNITAIQNASANATAAATSATNAAASETAAAASETAAATSETNAATSETNAATSASNAATSESNAATSETNAATSETNASTSETNAATSASNAATSESNAATSATSASNSATSASSAQSAAESARDATLTAYDNFDDRYLGVKSSAPTVDNDGNALVAGSLYFDSTSEAMQVYTGSAWVAAYVSGTGFAALTGATFTGDVTVPNLITSGNVDGRDVSADGTKLDGIEANATADQTGAEIKTAYEAEADTNAFTDALLTKLNGIEASATADQTASEILTAIKTVDGSGSGLDADTVDGIEASSFLRSNAADAASGTLTFSGDLNFQSNTIWVVSSGDAATQRVDARDDSSEARMHWYGQNSSGGTSNYRHAWYDGSAYINVTAASGQVGFGGNVNVGTSGTVDSGGQLNIYRDGNPYIGWYSSSTTRGAYLQYVGSGDYYHFGDASYINFDCNIRHEGQYNYNDTNQYIWWSGQSYGNFRTAGGNVNGYSGIEFSDSANDTTLMIRNSDGLNGVYRADAGSWFWYSDSSNHFRSYGNVTAYASDERLKNFYGKVESSLEKICQIDGLYYEWDEEACSKTDFTPVFNKMEIGLKAQQVESLFPEVVELAPFDTDPMDKGVNQSKSGENYLTLHYERLVPVLIEAIKELKAEIDVLKGIEND